jgi:hypothetical protein
MDDAVVVDLMKDDAELGRWRKLPPMDSNTLRRDIDEIIDPSP